MDDVDSLIKAAWNYVRGEHQLSWEEFHYDKAGSVGDATELYDEMLSALFPEASDHAHEMIKVAVIMTHNFTASFHGYGAQGAAELDPVIERAIAKSEGQFVEFKQMLVPVTEDFTPFQMQVLERLLTVRFEEN